MNKIHYRQEGENVVKRPACNPAAYDSYEWVMTSDKKKVNCHKCIRIISESNGVKK